MRKKGAGFLFIAASMAAVMLLNGCRSNTGNSEKTPKYERISAKEAKQIMDTETGYIILDVREQEEYDEGHIIGAVLLPLGKISEKAETVLPDKSQAILVYCRSGRRSVSAAQDLADLGYENVKEFGGILDWPYEIEK